ncbi:MAG: AAA family ATPase [Anaerolineae bacterium]|nr:AAA family ATPase [Anaerolineae bacterium]
MVQEEELDTQQLEGVVVQHDSGIKLILAPGNPLESDPLPTQSFHTLVENLRRFYDYIIIDTAPFLDEALVAVIQSADEVVVVTTSTMPALKDTRILFNLIQQLKEAPESDDSTAGKDHIFLVLNQFDPKVSRITPDQIANFLKHRIDAEIPFDLAGAVGSMNNGIPWITVDPRRSPAVQPQMNMVQIIRERFEKTSVAAASDAAPAARQPGRGLFGR